MIAAGVVVRVKDDVVCKPGLIEEPTTLRGCYGVVVTGAPTMGYEVRVRIPSRGYAPSFLESELEVITDPDPAILAQLQELAA